MQVQVTEAVGEERLTVCRLWQLFMHDVSELSGYDVDAQGFYDNDFQMDDDDTSRCLPHLVKVEGELAGLAIVLHRRYVAPGAPKRTRFADYYISDFFVLRKYRGRGVGRAVVNILWDRLPGKWAVAQLINHAAATAFWRSVIAERTGGEFWEEPDAEAEMSVGHRMQTFHIRPATDLATVLSTEERQMPPN